MILEQYSSIVVCKIHDHSSFVRDVGCSQVKSFCLITLCIREQHYYCSESLLTSVMCTTCDTWSSQTNHHNNYKWIIPLIELQHLSVNIDLSGTAYKALPICCMCEAQLANVSSKLELLTLNHTYTHPLNSVVIVSSSSILC